MDALKKKAINKFRPSLSQCIKWSLWKAHFHEDADGFLCDEEEYTINSKGTNSEQITELLSILKCKGNSAFEAFCCILQTDKHLAEWAKKLLEISSAILPQYDGQANVIPSFVNDFIRIKGTFIAICKDKHTPTLEELRSYCSEAIALARGPSKAVRHSQCEKEIEQCKNIENLAKIIFTQLCSWITFDFLECVLDYFPESLRCVREVLDKYKVKMKAEIETKLKDLSDLQSGCPDECENRDSFVRIIAHRQLEADGICIQDLVHARNFLSHRLKIRKELLQVLSTFPGSVNIVLVTLRELADVVLESIRSVKEYLKDYGILTITVGSGQPIEITPPITNWEEPSNPSITDDLKPHLPDSGYDTTGQTSSSESHMPSSESTSGPRLDSSQFTSSPTFISSGQDTLTDDTRSEVSSLQEASFSPFAPLPTPQEDVDKPIHTFVDTSSLSDHAKVIMSEAFKCMKDSRVQIDIGHLSRVMCRVNRIYDGSVLVAGPSSKDSLWNQAEKEQVKLLIQRPPAHADLETSKRHNIKDMMKRLVFAAPQPGCLVLATCDKQLEGVLVSALERKWSIELWSWSNAFSAAFVARSQTPGCSLSVHTLDENTHEVVCIEDEFRPEVYTSKEIVDVLTKHCVVLRVDEAVVVSSRELSEPFRRSIEKAAQFPAFYYPATKESVKGNTRDFLAVFKTSKGDVSFDIKKFASLVQKQPVAHLMDSVLFAVFKSKAPGRHARLMQELQKVCKDKDKPSPKPRQPRVIPVAATTFPVKQPLISQKKMYPCIYFMTSSCRHGYDCDFAHSTDDAWCPRCQVRGHFVNTTMCRFFQGQVLYTHQQYHGYRGHPPHPGYQHRETGPIGSGRPKPSIRSASDHQFMEISGAEARKLGSSQLQVVERREVIYKVEKISKNRKRAGKDLLESTPSLKQVQGVAGLLTARHPHKWQQVCQNLGVPYDRIKECETIPSASQTQACVVAMEIWRNRELASVKLPTWAILIDALERAGLLETTIDIEGKLMRGEKLVQ